MTASHLAYGKEQLIRPEVMQAPAVWLAEDLLPKWQAMGAKTVADLQLRLAGDIGCDEQVGSLPEGETPIRVETRGFALASGS